MIAFALKTLSADRGKLMTGVAGVVFSLLLVNIQGGLYFGLMRKASLLVDHCDADLWVAHSKIENVDLAREIPESWMDRIRGLRGVQCAKPYIVGKGTATLAGGRMEDVWVIGSDPSLMLGTGWGFIEGSVDDLKRPDAISVDEIDDPKLGHPQVGQWLEVNGCRAQVTARTGGITGFITMPYLFATYETARRMSHVVPGACSFILVKLEAGTSRERIAEQIRRRVPDASVLTPGEFARMSQDYWMNRTGIGISFGASTGLGVLVGLMMVGQSLYALALDHADEYATLKALGAEEGDIARVIAAQALAIAFLGTVAGLAGVLVIRSTWRFALAPIEMPPQLIAAGVALVFVICVGAALLPWLRVRRIDPATALTG